MQRPAFFLTLAAALACGASWADGPASAQAQQRYESERAACLRGDSNQDRATCLQEAGAARQDTASRSPVAGGDAELARNRLRRCEGLPSPEREDCTLRIEAGSTEGSAQQGGILREVTQPTK